MNRFRVNLHPAFFYGEGFRGDFANEKVNYVNPDTNPDTNPGGTENIKTAADLQLEAAAQQFKQEIEQKKTEIKQETLEVTDSVIQNPNFSNVAGKVASEVSSKYTDMEQLKRDRERFKDRHELRSGENGQGEVYAKVWEKKIQKGFDDLINTLEQNKYFDDCKDDEAKTQKTADIMVQYSKEVQTQYEKNIWSAGNDKFNNIKDTIFGKESEDYPASKIYQSLTGATTFFNESRTYVEGYEAEILNWDDNEESSEDANESMSDRQNRKFLSNDLPQYLWNIRKTPGVLKALSFLPIFSMKEDRPSKVDRKAIKQFLKTASKITVTGDKDKAVALMEVFYDNTLSTNSGKENYRSVLNKKGIKVDEKYLDDIVKAGSFYINTQRTNNSTRDQHAIYLSVLKIIENAGGVSNAVDKFKGIVEQGKEDIKKEKKQGYESEENLGEFKGFAEKLGISDFVSFNRLLKKEQEYFENTPVEKILANLNNDDILDARDTIVGGSKTGSQFIEIFNQVGKEKALHNLLEHAKLLNKTLGFGLDEANFTKERIKEGDTKLIILLQDIINKPGEDLYTLLSGHSENPFEGIDFAVEKESADKAAAEIISKMDKEALKKDGLTLPTPESMQTGLATALYTEYKRGIGLGGKVSFDQWIKGVELNTGFQVRDGGVVMLGIGIDYRKKINLGKGWSTTPELSAGTFIPLGMGKIEEIAGSVGVNDEVAKERITKKGIKQHLGIQGGVTLMPAGVLVLSAGLKWEQDKLAGIESAEQKKMIEFKDKIMGKILVEIKDALNTYEGGNTNLDFKNFKEETIISIKNAILKIAGDQNVPEKDRNMVTNAVMRLLVNYNGFDIGNEEIRDVIAQGIAEQYAMAWAEDRKAHISDKAYLSGVNLGAFWVAGSPLVGIYAGAKFTNHDLDGYGDKWGNKHELNNSKNEAEWDKKRIDILNQRLGLSGSEILEFTSDGYINVPKSITNRIKVSEDMKGLMYKDDKGNVILSKWTIMRENIRQGAATKSKELCIGAGPDFKTHLDIAGADWFKDNMDDINTGLLEKANDALYTVDTVKKAIAKLKLITNDPTLMQHEFTDNDINTIVNDLKKLNPKDKKAKITVEKQKDGSFDVVVSQTNVQGKGIELEYKRNLEMFDSKAKEIADSVYERAAKLDNPTALNRIKHPVGNELPAYKNFVAQLNGKNYEAAKTELLQVIAKLNESYTGNKAFPEIKDWPEDEALGQLLMSINNIFARSIKVKGKGSTVDVDGNKLNQYEFTTQMGNIVAEREGQISSTLDKKLSPEKAALYKKLIDATKKYRETHEGEFNHTSAKSAHLDNTVSFNLGDQTNPENPLINSEIYEYGMMDSKKLEECGFDLKDQEKLHRRTIENFIKNEALFKPIKEILGIKDGEVKIEDGAELKNGKIRLDIGGKKVTLSSEMKFGYFTQCVNHTVILDNISVEDENGNSMNFGSGTWANGQYVEGNKSSIVSSTTLGVDVSLTFGKKEEENKQDTTTNPEEEKRKKNNDESSNTGADDEGKTKEQENPETGGPGQSGKETSENSQNKNKDNIVNPGTGHSGNGGGDGRSGD